MNHPTFVESASPAARVTHGFRFATARRRSLRKTLLFEDVARARPAAFRADPVAARESLTVGESMPNPTLDTAELAARTAVSSVILGLDETITKE